MVSLFVQSNILNGMYVRTAVRTASGCSHLSSMSERSQLSSLRHPRLSASVRGQMFTGVLVTEKHGQIFTGELKFCNEDSEGSSELFLW